MGGSSSIIAWKIGISSPSKVVKVVPINKEFRYEDERPAPVSHKSGGDVTLVEDFVSEFSKAKMSSKSLQLSDIEQTSFSTAIHSSSVLSPNPSIPNLTIYDHSTSSYSFDKSQRSFDCGDSVDSRFQFQSNQTANDANSLPMEDYQDLLSFHLTSAKSREVASLLLKNENCRKLFIRFIKENQLKWLELLCIQTLTKLNQNHKQGISSSGAKSPSSSSLSQYLSSSTLTFHSYLVTKPILYSQAPSNWNSDRLSFRNFTSSFSKPAITSYDEDEEECVFFDERKTLDIVNLMKQLKIKDTMDIGHELASSKSNDSYDQTIGYGMSSSSKERSNIEKLLSKSLLTNMMMVILLNIFPYTQQYQLMESKHWEFDIDSIVFQPAQNTSSPSNNKNANYVNEFRISNLIQQSKTAFKNESLYNLQTLFYQLSKELDEVEIESILARDLDWFDNILPSLSSLPVAVMFCKNLHTDIHKYSNSFVLESLPIVYANDAAKELVGISTRTDSFVHFANSPTNNNLIGKNLMNLLLPKKDLKMMLFPKNAASPRASSKSKSDTNYNYYNERKLVHKVMEANSKGEKYKVGLIQENKFTSFKNYNFLNASPIYFGNKYTYLLSLHYNINDESAKISDLKVMDDISCLLTMVTSL
jgi:hypothetical protein